LWCSKKEESFEVSRYSKNYFFLQVVLRNSSFLKTCTDKCQDVDGGQAWIIY